MPGRKPKPIDPGAPPAAARFGSKLRELRLEAKLTQIALGELAGFTHQHISGLERTKAHPTKPAARALDAALEANGALLALVDAVLHERAMANADRRATRLCGETVALGCAVHRDAGDDDVEPTTRLGLLEAGVATALGVPVLGAAPTQAGEVDPGLVDHWLALLDLLSGYDATHGPREVLGVVQRELRVIAEYREIAHGELRAALMRVEACWSEFGAWLAHDCGDVRSRDALLGRALHLAHEADYPDLIALSRARQAQWVDAPRALRLAEAGLRTPHASPQARAVCAGRVAHAHARIGDAESAQRVLDEATQLISLESAAPWSPRSPAAHELAAWEARCWLALDPRKAVALFDKLLRGWPHTRLRTGGLHQGRLALACARAGELDRARAEAARALAIYKQTQSASAARELRQLGAVLKAA